jgi:hypothetical protein
MADGRATKIVVPTELAGIAGSLTAVADLLGGRNGSGDSGGVEPSPATEPAAPPQATRRRVDRPPAVPPATPPGERT